MCTCLGGIFFIYWNFLIHNITFHENFWFIWLFLLPANTKGINWYILVKMGTSGTIGFFKGILISNRQFLITSGTHLNFLEYMVNFLPWPFAWKAKPWSWGLLFLRLISQLWEVRWKQTRRYKSAMGFNWNRVIDCLMTVSWLSHDCLMTVSWLSHDCLMTVL